MEEEDEYVSDAARALRSAGVDLFSREGGPSSQLLDFRGQISALSFFLGWKNRGNKIRASLHVGGPRGERVRVLSEKNDVSSGVRCQCGKVTGARFRQRAQQVVSRGCSRALELRGTRASRPFSGLRHIGVVVTHVGDCVLCSHSCMSAAPQPQVPGGEANPCHLAWGGFARWRPRSASLSWRSLRWL